MTFHCDAVNALQRLHTARLKVSFSDDEVEQDRDIDILTQEIQRVIFILSVWLVFRLPAAGLVARSFSLVKSLTHVVWCLRAPASVFLSLVLTRSQLWRKVESNIKRVAIAGNAAELGLSPTEHTVRLNVMRANATRLQDLSKRYRQFQQEFIQRLKDQKNLGKDFFFDEAKDEQGGSRGPLSLDEALEKGFTQEQLVQMQEMELNASEREKEILRIAQSINDLSQLFQELSVLVIEQGTILDRIDYHVERSLDQVRSGTRELEKAESYSKKMRTMKCLICLFLACVVEALILVGIHSDKK